jgi:hypothetical protein
MDRRQHSAIRYPRSSTRLTGLINLFSLLFTLIYGTGRHRGASDNNFPMLWETAELLIDGQTHSWINFYYLSLL